MKEEIIKSIRKIDKQYFNHPNTFFKDNKIVKNDEEIKAIEATFVADFRGNLKQLITTKGLSFRFDVDAPKTLVYSDRNTPAEIRNTYNKIFGKITVNDITNEEKLYRRPDVVVHKSVESKEKEDQILICEIKTDPLITEDDFYADFFKLNIYLYELNFQFGAFIAANINHTQIIEWLTNYIKDGLFINHANNRIFLISIDEKVERMSICDFSTVKITNNRAQPVHIANKFEFINFK